MSSFWDYRARQMDKEIKRESKVKRVTQDLEKTQDVWKGIEVKESHVSDTGRFRLRKLFGIAK